MLSHLLGHRGPCLRGMPLDASKNNAEACTRNVSYFLFKSNEPLCLTGSVPTCLMVKSLIRWWLCSLRLQCRETQSEWKSRSCGGEISREIYEKKNEQSKINHISSQSPFTSLALMLLHFLTLSNLQEQFFKRLHCESL